MQTRGRGTRIDEKAPVRASGSVEISASPLEVWAVLTDIDHWPSWNPEMDEARLDGQLVEGGTFVWRSAPGKVSSVLRSVDAGHELSWTGTSWVAHAVYVWHIEPTRHGVRVTVEESWSGWSARLRHRSMARTLRDEMVYELHDLKTETEFRARRDLRLAA